MIIRRADKEALVHIFSAAHYPMEVWAYGSRVNGSAHEGSDLDLVARSSDLSPIPLAIIAGLRQQIQDSNIPILIELRDWALLPASFQDVILKGYEVVYDGR